MKRIVSLVLLLTFTTAGCGTIVHGTRQKITIESEPPGATVNVGNHVVETPATISLARSQDYMILVRKDGYEDGHAVLNRRFNGVASFLGNIMWLLPGLLIDIAAGGAWTLEPDHISVTLEKNGRRARSN